MNTETREALVRRLQFLGVSLGRAETIGAILLILGQIEQNKEWLLEDLRLEPSPEHKPELPEANVS